MRSFVGLVSGLIALMLFLLSTVSYASDIKRILGGEGSKRLQVILDTTVEDHGPFEIIQVPHMTEGRELLELKANKNLNFFSHPTDRDREATYLPIMLPLDDSLLGYRICLIRSDSQHLFDNIKSLEDWQAASLRVGSGEHWSDTRVLKANNIEVVTSITFDSLYGMLQAKRFECFHRGISEILNDQEKYASQGLVMEKNILLVYPYRDLFFVSRKDPELAERIKVGYQRALKNGTWQAYIKKRYEQFENLSEETDLDNRVIIHLDNPFMSEESKQIPPLLPFIQELHDKYKAK